MTREPPLSKGIVRATALPALALATATADRTHAPRRCGMGQTGAPEAPARSVLRLLAPLRSRAVRALAFDAVVLGALASFLAQLMVLRSLQPDPASGSPMLLAILLLVACWTTVLGRDLRRLLKLLRRWRFV